MAKKDESKSKKSAAQKPKAAAKKPAAEAKSSSSASHAKTTHAKSDAHKTTAKSSHAPAKAASHAPAKSSSHAHAKPHKAHGGGSSPMIDTNLAASAAASFLFAKRKGRDRLTGSTSVDQIKSDLSKSHADVAGNVLDQHAESSGGRRPDLPNMPQRGGNLSSQTVGQAAQRMSVPRRTSG